MEKKIVVTGAGGYIGRHVVIQLLDMGCRVVACDFEIADVDPRADRRSLDIFSGDKDLFQQLGEPDVCLHMAWKDGFVHNSDAHMMYLSKHFEFIRTMTDGGLKHIAIMGTMHEIGYWEGAINEDTPSNPTSMYGIAKDSLRRSTNLLYENSSISWQWLRAFYIYGNDSRNNSVFAKILQAAEEGKKIFPFTSGKNEYDFISVQELAYLIALCIVQNKVNGIINCCSGKPVSLAERVESFIKEHELDIELEYGAFPDRPYDSPRVWGDASKINRILQNKEG